MSQQHQLVSHHGPREATAVDWRHRRANTDAANANSHSPTQRPGESSKRKKNEAVKTKLDNQKDREGIEKKLEELKNARKELSEPKEAVSTLPPRPKVVTRNVIANQKGAGTADDDIIVKSLTSILAIAEKNRHHSEQVGNRNKQRTRAHYSGTGNHRRKPPWIPSKLKILRRRAYSRQRPGVCGRQAGGAKNTNRVGAASRTRRPCGDREDERAHRTYPLARKRRGFEIKAKN